MSRECECGAPYYWIVVGIGMGLLVVLIMLVMSCASIESYPRRACLYSDATHWRSGTVTERRADGARLFRFDDTNEGDHGYKWVDDDDRRLMPCRANEFDRYSAEHP